MNLEVLDEAFFVTQRDPVKAAKSLLGKFIWVRHKGTVKADQSTSEGSELKAENLDNDSVYCSQIIEVEAYGPEDNACHARNWRRTPTNSILFESGGRAYVYLCHVHCMLNISFAEENHPACVLVRSVVSVIGEGGMRQRRQHQARKRGHRQTDFKNEPWTVGRGPGNLTQALGIDKSLYGNRVFDAGVGIWISRPPKDAKDFSDLKAASPQFQWTEPGPNSWLPEAEQKETWIIGESPRIGVASAGEDAKRLWRFFVASHRGVSKGPMVWPDYLDKKRKAKDQEEEEERSDKKRKVKNGKSLARNATPNKNEPSVARLCEETTSSQALGETTSSHSQSDFSSSCTFVSCEESRQERNLLCEHVNQRLENLDEFSFDKN
eukprot:Gregarina_sp_Poly_1__1775@NODE_145_length_12880_cov_78_207602_g130_i0_p3_GENE_NODE_145_length_12880_cov_78_207602_g130_i0NODE_145_length_12880_cov_78_207602_g130_i0_p3_ORF_typecomplete_len379_score61_36Pur_DNA_glyco/PF02245_16/1e40_NODE_145_length_12880_cov_78_207602_g130_i01098012116